MTAASTYPLGPLRGYPFPERFRVEVAGGDSVAGSSLPFPISIDGEWPGASFAPALSELTRPGMRVTIAFTDATRPSPDRLLVGRLLRELRAGGIPSANIILLCATGLHRPITREELLARLGADIVEGFTIVSHNALDPSMLVDLGAIDGIPLVINRLCAEADLLLATGVVEPHQYAGYSGGAKTVVIGCGSERTIQATHGAEMLDRPGTRIGAIDSNPFQAFVREGGRLSRLRYVLNVLLDGSGEIVDAAAGDPVAVHDYLVDRGREIFETPVRRPAQMAVAGIDPSKGANLYQASRGATYLALADRTALLPGAPILLVASLPEGVGRGTGEGRFFQALSSAASPAELLEELRRTGFPAGAQRAYILAQALLRNPLIIVGAGDPEIVRRCHILAAADLEEGLTIGEKIARERFRVPAPGKLDLLVVPNALLTLPKVAGA